jgi:hypothetical protein
VSKEFRQLALDAVDDGLVILGDEPVIHAFYDSLQKRRRIKREEIFDNLNVLHEFMKYMFQEGARILEKRMAKSLYRKVGLLFTEHADWTLTQYIEEARMAYRSM